ncbi:MAG: PaaI family thioesterase [Planctomycetes bacterium]|nr:PaaI family thioesterase [Planctomycetota bacterium]
MDKEALLEVMGHDAYAAAAGMEVIRAEPGYAEVRMNVIPSIKNGHGNVHGGAMFTLADYTAAVASNFLGTPTLATDGSISFMKAVRDGHLIAKCTTRKAGRRMNFQMVEIFNADGTLVALFQGSAIKVERQADKN